MIHCTALRRPDGKGANRNARIFQAMAREGVKLLPGSPASEIVPEIEVSDSDLVFSRLHGLSPFQGTELDFILRNLAVRTLVAVGVSVNLAIQNLTFDAVNAGYQGVIPRQHLGSGPRSQNGSGSSVTRDSTCVQGWPKTFRAAGLRKECDSFEVQRDPPISTP